MISMPNSFLFLFIHMSCRYLLLSNKDGQVDLEAGFNDESFDVLVNRTAL